MTGAIASLGMYDHPAQAAANDALWSGLSRQLRSRGVAAPRALDRSRSVDAVWRDGRLLFGQTCGYPLVSEPDLSLRVLGVPVYDVPGCSPGEHLSHVVVRHDDLGRTLSDHRGGSAAINAVNSNTGANLLRAAVAPFAREGRFFGDVIVTGSHRGSVAAVVRGDADIAAVDAVTLAALARHEPGLVAGLRVVADTAASPAPPFVTASSTPLEAVAALRAALAAAMADPALAAAREALFLQDVLPAGVDRFAPLLDLRRGAVDAGYPELR